MEKEFVPYEQALVLKELGFDEPCFGRYGNDSKMLYKEYSKELHSNWHTIAPLYQQAFRFFREKKYQAEILWRGDFGDFCWKIGRFKYGSHFFSDNGFNTYEEAELACLKKLIEIVNG
jgi:hypothetical protein